MKIIFMGTPEFAVASLEAIVKAEYEVAAVVTVPDKPAGRGKQLKMSEVKQCALSKNIPVLQPEKLKDPDFISTLKKLNADLFVVVAFRMLPEIVYTIPAKGTFNIHASLLPDYRGAAPIHRAVMNGETKTGVTAFFLNQKIDEGDLIACEETEIAADETTGELYDRLMQMGAELAVKTIRNIENEEVKTVPQNQLAIENLKLAPKILKEDMLICWNDSAQNIYNKIRGLSPFPGAYTRIKTVEGEEQIIKCYVATISSVPSTGIRGSFVSDGKTFIAVNTKDFQILLQNIQFQGKKRMDISPFLRGFRLNDYIKLLF